MGQGLNTKVQQTVAKELGVEMEMIKIKPTEGLISPNNSNTGGSWGSEICCQAAIRACAILNQNLAPSKDRLGPNATWQDIVTDANRSNVDLCAKYMLSPDNDGLTNYNIWAAAVTEVEIDVLTGEMYVVRCDLITDAGHSVSPLVDI